MNGMTRRDALLAMGTTSLAAGLGWPGGHCAKAAVPATRPREQALYALPLLGDMHYDKWEHHDLDWVRQEKPRDLRQIEGYVNVTAEHLPPLLAMVRERIRAAGVKVPGVLHIGDFVEGLCGSYELQALQFRDAMAFIESAQLEVPFLMAKGNHDITGPGAGEAFDDVLLPWMGINAGKALGEANYTWSHGKDLFVFFDAYRPDLDWLEGLVETARDARHVFFVIHPPVVPYNARSTWHVFSKEREQEDRGRLLAWLGGCGAVVLSGHLHRYGYLTRSTPQGIFSQLAVNSVVRQARVQARNQRGGLDAYGPALTDLEPAFSPDTLAERQAVLAREKPSIGAFDYARTSGHAMLWVYDDRVEADVYLGYTDERLAAPRLGSTEALSRPGAG